MATESARSRSRTAIVAVAPGHPLLQLRRRSVTENILTENPPDLAPTLRTKAPLAPISSGSSLHMMISAAPSIAEWKIRVGAASMVMSATEVTDAATERMMIADTRSLVIAMTITESKTGIIATIAMKTGLDTVIESESEIATENVTVTVIVIATVGIHATIETGTETMDV